MGVIIISHTIDKLKKSRITFICIPKWQWLQNYPMDLQIRKLIWPSPVMWR